MNSLLVRLSLIQFSTTVLAQSVNPPIDPRTRTDGYPTSPISPDGPSLKELSNMETKLWQARASDKADLVNQYVSDDAGCINGSIEARTSGAKALEVIWGLERTG